MASRRRLHADGSVVLAIADWLAEAGLFPPFRAMYGAGATAFHLPHPLLSPYHRPADKIDATILRLNFAQRTTASSAN